MGGCNKMDGKKMKAGWIGFLREEPDIWKSVEKLSALGYRGLEGGDFLLVGDVDENRKRLADLNLQVLTTSAGMEEIREGPLCRCNPYCTPAGNQPRDRMVLRSK